eukprot:snap_masked-scaffold_39-processed-gene-2.46-mRNA-1 protein AED:1.00 eAED:1.00 QI:0/0/0/0/1/1/2/0/228
MEKFLTNKAAKSSVSLYYHTSSKKYITIRKNWKTLDNSSVISFVNRQNPSTKKQKVVTKVAAFDFDHTLWKHNFGKTFTYPKGLIFKNTKDMFLKLHNEGYKIFILSNENISVYKDEKKAEKWLNKKLDAVEEFFKCFQDNENFYIEVYLATRYDENRKISTKDLQKRGKGSSGIGLWKLVEKRYPQIDLENSFFVGDAAGREKDHSNADILFAKTVGIKFFTPEDPY